MGVEEVMRELGTALEGGLGRAEAGFRLEKYGMNQLTE